LDVEWLSFNHQGNVTGPNGYQNFPVLTLATTDGTSVRVAGTLRSFPGQNHRIDIFANPTCDPTSFGEGRTLLGSFIAGTDDSGTGSFDQTLPAGTAEPAGISA